MEKKYWKGLEELHSDAEFVKQKNNEFAEALPLEDVFSSKATNNSTTDRRDFLKFLGFGVAAATLASCEAPVKKTIPYLIKPEEITPGVANWYASTYADGSDYCSILVKTREGRPIKIEGNPNSTITKGGVNARVQASVLSLYDTARLRGPLAAGKAAKWDDVDQKIVAKLNAVNENKGNIRILTASITSPSTKKAISEFTAKYPSAKQITYDAVSYSGMIEANKNSFGKAVLPSYRFDNASVIVSFGADFLGGWISSVEYSNQYIQTRKLRGTTKMSRHIQFETALSLTGSNADKRVAIKPSEQALAILNLYNQIATLAGSATVSDKAVPCAKDIKAAAQELWAAKGKALVVSSSNDTNTQMMVNAINNLLGSYSSTIDLDNHCNIKQGNDAAMVELMEEMNKGEVAAVILYGVNPALTSPKVDDFKKGLAKVGLKISFADRADETASLCDFVCPDHNYLEAWNDAEPKKGNYSLAQPTISPLFSTRAAQESLLSWSGNKMDYMTYMQENWKGTIATTQSLTFDAFWTNSIQSGLYTAPNAPATATTAPTVDLAATASAIISNPAPKGDLEVVFYEKSGIGNGAQANNPWLQEFPDPISKVTWDNYLAVSPKYAGDNGLVAGTVVNLEANGQSVKLPVLLQPGQAYGTASVAIGYGRTHAGKAANGVGANVYPMISVVNKAFHMMAAAKITKTNDALHEFAATQTHHTMMGRAIVKETTLAEYIKNPAAGNAPELIQTNFGKRPSEEVTLWNEHENPKHRWGMAIDLNACIGCGGCVVGCQAENNVPVVGKDEVRRSREMHWIRIDRYYTSDMNEERGHEEHKGTKDVMHEMEVPSENPQVVFQPVMCQHCNHAPCETVCPVAATNHSSEGLNQMAYNRCIGTRYCANNCPYKVRRFNWFSYTDNNKFDFNMNDDLGKMVLNPDVVVRSRGVMEKCSMCVQRIQEGKHKAKKENRNIVDGEFKTACAQSCPTNAIVFGDYQNPDSEIAKLEKDQRAYHLLGELNVQPNIIYLTKVRNTMSNEA